MVFFATCIKTIFTTHMSSLLLVTLSVVGYVTTMGALCVKSPPLVLSFVTTDHLRTVRCEVKFFATVVV